MAKTTTQAFNDLGKELSKLKYEILKPLTQALAFQKSVQQVACLVPPKHHKQMQTMRKVGKCLPKDLRGVYIELVRDKMMSDYPLSKAIGVSLTEILDFTDEEQSNEN